MDENEYLKNNLLEKVENEINQYEEYLKEQPANVILENSYQYTCKKEIVDYLNEKDYSNFELKQLIKVDNLLDDFYAEWLHSDGNLRESLEFVIDDEIDKIRDKAVERAKSKNQMEAR